MPGTITLTASTAIITTIMATPITMIILITMIMRGARLAVTWSMRELAGPLSWRKILAVVFSVGIRPCTGAILVLIFALTQGVFWAGVAATFAMAIGTAITVAVLATLALGSRELALKLGGRSGAFADTVWTICTLGGSALILLFGATLFAASLGPVRQF